VTDALNGLYRPVSPLAVVGAVASVVLLIGALACLAPTLRGLRIQPTEALRSEG
jgi:ABC-type lipoprotein release transport system permease subunit